jgi:protein subunit release factor A
LKVPDDRAHPGRDRAGGGRAAAGPSTADLERQLADPAVHTDAALARRLGRRYAELGAVQQGYREWKAALDDHDAAVELAAEEPSFAEELPALTAQLDATRDRLHRLLVPRDPDDDRDVILEIKAGEGGEESALFAGTCSGCTCATPSGAAGGPRSWRPPRAISAATRTFRSR